MYSRLLSAITHLFDERNEEGVDMNYYNEIKNKIIKSEIYARVKDYSKERNKV